MKRLLYTAALGLSLLCGSCSDFLDEQVPQGTIDNEQLRNPEYVDNLVISAYAIWISAEDINSSFSMWNYDVRSDDAYKGGNGTEDGDVFHALEISQGIMTTAWNISDMWQRLYNCISRANTALQLLNQLDEQTYPLKQQRIAEMRFLRGHGHFLLKQLYKKIVFANDENLSPEEYNNLSNTTYTNDEGWQQIANDFEFAYNNLPDTQADKGRPTRGAAAAYLAKTYLYKAYRQDNPESNEVTSISAEDLQRVVEYTDPSIMAAGGYALEADFHNNFRPEPQYENGCESVWAMQYSMNDGTTDGNCNWAYGLIVPNIPGVTDGGCDFYKPSQNLVNAFRTDADGHPYFDTFNNSDYDMATETADPRLFLTVGLPDLPYEFNANYIMDRSSTWSRSNGLYGYYVTLKQNVDPDGDYIVRGNGYWGSPMNHIVLRYADVLLMRAEALIQLNDGRIQEAIDLINEVRNRARQSTAMISNYPADYNVTFNVRPYTGSYSQQEALEMLKFERRLELAMECDRFFDLVRWGDAYDVLTRYYAQEADNCTIYSNAAFTPNKNEYLPIPFAQISASNGLYEQNCGNW
ncbi:MAG: RagB/SusD family nutrient uptake outer membrane protein [Candidatus Bacteroides intestinipullorum]|uniref:RagB/SusD family nutrient uptake outer membrane protein n=1 Tax=Candidatus Bacteroides intestinipullorum TaxID=2838471 RepID=A0A9E2NMT4_9BACE|nr:RagB/SusD family nutrient uptake outer membrane protein [Candidatus Bacteroides intestinipullorum]